MEPGGGAMTNRHVADFEARALEPGESVLFSLSANWGGSGGGAKEGAAILTDRRICFHRKGLLGRTTSAVPATGDALRYQPDPGPPLVARFETDAGALAFAVGAGEDEAQLGVLLGKLRDLREAQADLADAGYSPRQHAGGAQPSPEYRLVRLKELADMGLHDELEYRLQRRDMIAGIVAEDAGGS